jgi:hypothetical protein
VFINGYRISSTAGWDNVSIVRNVVDIDQAPKQMFGTEAGSHPTGVCWHSAQSAPNAVVFAEGRI